MVRRGSATGARPAARRRLRQERGAGNVVLTFLLKRRAVPYVREGAVLAPDVPVLPPRCSRPRRANRRGGQAAVSVSGRGRCECEDREVSVRWPRRREAWLRSGLSLQGRPARRLCPSAVPPALCGSSRILCSLVAYRDSRRAGALLRSPIRCRASSALAPPRRAHGAHAGQVACQSLFSSNLSRRPTTSAATSARARR